MFFVLMTLQVVWFIINFALWKLWPETAIDFQGVMGSAALTLVIVVYLWSCEWRNAREE